MSHRARTRPVGPAPMISTSVSVFADTLIAHAKLSNRAPKTTFGLEPTLRPCVLVHPDDLPDVPVEIVEAPAEHVSVIDRRPSFDRARAQSRVHHPIDLGLALQG